MSRVVRMLVVTAVCTLGLGALAGSASAGIWTEIPSGTSSTITAIEYQSDTRFWFTTAGGAIYKRNASGFAVVRPASAVPLNDIEFQAGGQIGLAVGDGGQVLRSINGGDSWTPVTGIPVSNVGDGSGNWCTSSVPLGDVHFVRFAGNGRAWIGADQRQLAVSKPADAANVGATGWWTDANRKVPPVAGDNCWIDQNEGFADMFVTTNPDVFYIATGAFGGTVLFSTNNLVGRKVRVRMRGAVKPPQGVAVKTACSGKIKLTLKKKKRTLATRTVKLKLKKGKCRFAKTVLVPRKKVGSATSLRLTVRFQGNRVLKAGQKRYTLLITR